jgi:ABC-type glycerol-3-phosphate transport system permease component
LYFDEHVFFALNSFRLLIPATLLYLFLMFKNKGIDKTYAYVILFLMFFSICLALKTLKKFFKPLNGVLKV